jgi:hypothetical protein
MGITAAGAKLQFTFTEVDRASGLFPNETWFRYCATIGRLEDRPWFDDRHGGADR